MNLGIRSKLSLCQFLGLLDRNEVVLLLEKYEIATDKVETWSGYDFIEGLRNTIPFASFSQIGNVVQEVARTQNSIRSSISPRYRFDERWQDLSLSLQLDNYALARNEHGRELDYFVPTEPAIDGAQPVEDDLSKELGLSGLAETGDILRLIEDSASAFFRAEYNSCLNNARVALETLARSIGRQRAATHPTAANIGKWGEVVTYLRTSGFITIEQEKGLAGVYGFVSPGSHIPVGFTESEFARLGRTLALSCTYFLVKRRNGG
jgi:hypothetical protein